MDYTCTSKASPSPYALEGGAPHAAASGCSICGLAVRFESPPDSASPGTDKTDMNFRRSLPEIRWQSCLSPGPGAGCPEVVFRPCPWFAPRDTLGVRRVPQNGQAPQSASSSALARPTTVELGGAAPICSS